MMNLCYKQIRFKQKNKIASGLQNEEEKNLLPSYENRNNHFYNILLNINFVLPKIFPKKALQ